MSLTELIDFLPKIAAALGVLWAAYLFLRYRVEKLRAEPQGVVDLENERAYLLAFEGYIEDLDR